MAMRPLRMVDSLFEEISKISFDIGTTVWVDVVHIVSPHSFFVRPTAYNKYLPLIEVQENPPETSEIKIGDVYVFSSKLKSCKIRGKIVSHIKSNDAVIYSISAIDYGFIEENVSHECLWKSRYRNVPSLVTHCRLVDCEPRHGQWNEGDATVMRDLVKGEQPLLIVKDKTPEILSVELQSTCADDISTLLAYCEISTLGYVHGAVKCIEKTKVKELKYAQRQFKNGTTLHVRFQSGSFQEQFYVALVEEYKIYLNDRDEFTRAARYQAELSLDDLKLEAPIGVYYDKRFRYERGIVKELFPGINKAKVLLVDWGLEVVESVMKMTPVPDWYLRIPIRAIFCTCLFRNAIEKKKIENFSLKSGVGTEFIITIKAVGSEDRNGIGPLNRVMISQLR